MKAELQAKFLLFWMQKRRQETGFTLIELLVVIIIIGILSAIALPAFLTQANKARQSEAKQTIGSMNRAQQSYYLENSAFSSTVENLGLGITTQTTNYRYGISMATGESGSINPDATFSIQMGLALKNPLKHYLGRTEIGVIAATSEATTLAILCETLQQRGLNSTPQRPPSSSNCAADAKRLD